MTTIIALALVALLATVLACAWHRCRKRNSTPQSSLSSRIDALGLFANIGEGTHEGNISKKVDAAITTRYLLAKKGTDADHVDKCGAADKPLGVMTDEAKAAEDFINVELLGITKRTLLMVASEPITQGADVYTAANGKVQDEPAAAGTFWLVGRAITAAAADLDEIEVQHIHPIKVVVQAVLGNTNNEIGGLTIGGTYTQAEVVALRDKTEELADDVRNIATSLASPALLKILSS